MRDRRIMATTELFILEIRGTLDGFDTLAYLIEIFSCLSSRVAQKWFVVIFILFFFILRVDGSRVELYIL